MNTLLIEVKDDKAYEVLQELEKQNVIKLLDKKEKNEITPESPTAKYRGALNLTEEEHNSLIQHIKTIRNEWPNSL